MTNNSPQKYDYGTQLKTVPDNAPALPTTRNIRQPDNSWVNYEITHAWPYHNENGKVIFYVCRYETPQGKETLQLTLWEKSGSFKWNWKWYPRPLPSYNLHLLHRCPDAQVIIVEGEKCADTLQHLIDHSSFQGKIVVTTAPGGTGNYDKADWSPLKNKKKVVLWEDHDLQEHPEISEVLDRIYQPGHQGMRTVAGFMQKYNVPCRMVNPYGKNHPAKWDVADAILNDHWDIKQVLEFIKQNVEEPPENIPLPEEREYRQEPLQEPLPSETAEFFPIKCLGYDHGNYFYMPRNTRQITILTPSEHTGNNLTSMAPITYWETMYPSKGGPIWRNAANDLMRACERRGIYDVARVRGRGAWVDKKRVVLHLGDKLLCDGKQSGLDEIDSKYVYEHGGLLDFDTQTKPLGNHGAHKLLNICDALTWEREIYSRYFAGWIVLAPICGALPWRPHLWITAKSGTGKSWILDHILKPCLGNFKLSAQSNTTEAGLRQKLKCDSLPVTFDEIENENIESTRRIQHILELSRQASSESDTGILKGSQSGRAIEYKIRSMFFFSSIAVSLSQQADISRVTVASLMQPHDWTPEQKAEHFDALQQAVNSTITEEWCESLRARSIKLIPVIVENARVFARAAAKTIGTQRAGDQIGTLLAGAYSLASEKVIDLETATEWINQREWEEERATLETDDSTRCLDVIMQHIVKDGSREANISNLLHCANESLSDRTGMVDMPASDAVTVLAKCGIALGYEGGSYTIYISSSHTYIKQRILNGTPWPVGWNRILKRIPNTVDAGNRRFAGVQSRCIGIPWGVVFGD